MKEAKELGACAAAKGDPENTVYYSEKLGFHIMLNGEYTPRSAEILSSSRITGFIEKMKEEMDLIIVDAPPVKGRADTEAWVRRADFCLLL